MSIYPLAVALVLHTVLGSPEGLRYVSALGSPEGLRYGISDVTAQAAAPPAQPTSTTLTDAQMEEFLKAGRVTRSGGTAKGVTGSTRATLTHDGLTHDAHIQIVEQKKAMFTAGPRPEVDFRDSWQFNVAAYRLDRMLGLRLVPVSIERSWRGDPAAFTWWVDDVVMDEGERLKKKLQPPDPLCWSHQVWALRVFDQLIDNIDRNLGNMVITKHWQLWGIDHTRAFRHSRAPRNPERMTRIDRALLEQLKALEFAPLKKEIGSYVADSDIRELLARRDGIVAHFATRGEGALYNRRDPNEGCLAK